jgi:hypothetical protein
MGESTDEQEILFRFYDHLVVRNGGYIDVRDTYEEDRVFIDWVRGHLRALFDDRVEKALGQPPLAD